MASMDEKALEEIALELYALPLDHFVAARTAAAKTAAGSGKELPAAVKALPKPSVAAWTVNLLAIHQPEVLEQLAGLGEKMRDAQTSLDAAAMRELARERRTLLSAAVGAAKSEAQHRGRSISATIASDVEETLRALTADEGAAAAVQSGLLVQTLSADGMDSVDLDGAVAVPGAVTVNRTIPRRAHAPAPKATAPANETATAKDKGTTAERPARSAPNQPRLKAVRQTPRPVSPSALEKAKAALAEAKAAGEESARVAEDRRMQLAEAETAVAELTRETRGLRDQLQAAGERLDRTRKQLGNLAAEAKQAARAAEKAQRSAMLAQERVLRLGSNTRD